MANTVQLGKRKRAAPNSTGRRGAAAEEPFEEGESARESAKPYLLTVAKLPLDVLDTTWSIGRNRCLDQAHVRELKEAFVKMGLERRADEHRLRVLCSADEVRRMQAAVPRQEKDGIASYLDWARFNGKVEVMAGQHRIQALRQFAWEKQALANELWWTCELYDRDRLPTNLNIKLRVNRRDPSLPDNQGQIWMQLVSIASDSGEAFPNNQVRVDHKLVEALRLGGERNFPTRRLVSLWNHERWRDKITQWCSTRLGLETFNISTFEWYVSLRIDEYWFAILDRVVDTLQAFPIDQERHLGREDWSRFVATLGRKNGWTKSDVESVFYKHERRNRFRVDKTFLASLDDQSYDALYNFIVANPKLDFLDLKRTFRPRKTELPIMVTVLQHVVAWIDTNCALDIEDISIRAKNKPLISGYMSKALTRLAQARGADGYAENSARLLQEQVLGFVDHNMGEFQKVEALPFLGQNLALVDTPQYAKRFTHPVWARLLQLVRQTTDQGDHVLRPSWQTACTTKGNERQDRLSSHVRKFCADIFKLADHPRLHDPAELQAAQQAVEEALAPYVGNGAEGPSSTTERPVAPSVVMVQDSQDDADDADNADDLADDLNDDDHANHANHHDHSDHSNHTDHTNHANHADDIPLSKPQRIPDEVTPPPPLTPPQQATSRRTALPQSRTANGQVQNRDAHRSGWGQGGKTAVVPGRGNRRPRPRSSSISHLESNLPRGVQAPPVTKASKRNVATGATPNFIPDWKLEEMALQAEAVLRGQAASREKHGRKHGQVPRENQRGK